MNIFMEAFTDEFEKQARVSLSGLEEYMGYYLPDDLEVPAREELRRQTASRFGVRHPWLTGIPTLGIWPAVAHSKAYSQTERKLFRKYPKARELAEAARQRYLEELEATKDIRIAQEQRAAKAEQAAFIGAALTGAASTAARAFEKNKE